MTVTYGHTPGRIPCWPSHAKPGRAPAPSSPGPLSATHAPPGPAVDGTQRHRAERLAGRDTVDGCRRFHGLVLQMPNRSLPGRSVRTLRKGNGRRHVARRPYVLDLQRSLQRCRNLPKPSWPAIRNSRTSCIARARRDAKRSKIFSKLSREITVAAPLGTAPIPTRTPGCVPRSWRRGPRTCRRTASSGLSRRRRGPAAGSDYQEVRVRGSCHRRGSAVIVEALDRQPEPHGLGGARGVRQARGHARRDRQRRLRVLAPGG